MIPEIDRLNQKVLNAGDKCRTQSQEITGFKGIVQRILSGVDTMLK
jgi:hypothetical protein